MGDSQLSTALWQQATILRQMASGIQASGRPIELVMAGKAYPCTEVSSLDLIDDACAFEADAAKLNTIYNLKLS